MAKSKSPFLTGADILLPYIRLATKEDKKRLPQFSHSKLEQFKNCPYAYKLKYVDGNYSSDSSIALESGTLAHLLLELKGISLKLGEKIDYDRLHQIRENGYDELKPIPTNVASDSRTEEFNITNQIDHTPGRKELMLKYLEDYAKPDSEGRNYDEKWRLFDTVLHKEMEDDEEWEAYAFEQNFDFVWAERIILHGFIDRIDRKPVIDEETGEIIRYDYRVIDYKTSKKRFKEEDVKTSQQMAIYACAVLLMEGVLPIEYKYRFVFLDDAMNAFTPGWEKRFITSINKKLDAIEAGKADEKVFKPKTGLCYWCNYSATNPNAKEYRGLCKYYSHKTPENNDYSVNCKWGEEVSSNPAPDTSSLLAGLGLNLPNMGTSNSNVPNSGSRNTKTNSNIIFDLGL